jgi:spermidine/putrescine-binding protein
MADVLCACSSATFAPSGSTLPPTPTPSPSGALRVLAPPSSVDAVIAAFSSRTGVTVRSTATPHGGLSPEALGGGASSDVVLLPDRAVPVLAGRGLLRALDMRLLGNFEYVQGAFRAPPYDRGDPVRYSVPFQFSTLGLAVRRDVKASAQAFRWADLWQRRFKGGVRVDASGRSVIGVGLLSLGFPLGSLDRSQVDLAVTRLIELKTNLQIPGPEAAPAAVTVCWSPQALRTLRSTPKSVRFVLPPEGFEIVTETLCVPRSASNWLAAHAFLDFCLRPGVQRAVAERLGTQSAEPEAWLYLSPLARSFARSDLQLAHGQWQTDLGSVGAVYDRAWAAVAREWGRPA